MSAEPGASFSVSDFVRHHFESGCSALRGTPMWVWPIPFVFGFLVYLLIDTPLGIVTTKAVEEIVGQVISGMAVVAAFWVHRRADVFFTLLLTLFSFTLFLRELHFWGTSEAVFVALAALAWWASSRREEVLPYLRITYVGPSLAAALWIYIVTQIVDQHYLLTAGLVPLDDYLSWNDNVEETLETVGHLFLLSAAVLTGRAVLKPPAAEPGA